MIDYVLCLIVRSVSWIVRLFPLPCAIACARAIGFVSYYVFRKKRLIAYVNIKTAFPSFSRQQIKHTIRKLFMNCAQHLVEILYLPRIDGRYVDMMIDVSGFDEVKQRIADGRGIIFFGLHYGSWEVTNAALSYLFQKQEFVALARPQTKLPRLNRLLHEYRARNRKEVLTIDDDLRPLISRLKSGKAVGVLGDHGGSPGGVFVDFFGKPALTPVGGIKLALKLNTHIIIGFVHKKAHGKHAMVMRSYEPMVTGNLDNDIKVNLERLHREYESYIRHAPDEYLWFFKRWKHSPQKNILIVSDGKAGHVKQSRALASIMKQLPYRIHVDEVEVRFPARLHRLFFSLCALFFHKTCQGCLWCMRRSGIGIETSLPARRYDAIVSCGSRLAMVNRLLAYEHGAKSIVIMRPGMFSVKRFDLVIMPAHDRPVRARNVITIQGSLASSLDPADQDMQRCIVRYGLDHMNGAFVIGVMIGGDNRYLSLEADTIEQLLVSLKEYSERKNAVLLVSTSRRTSGRIIATVKQQLSGYDRCKMCIIASEENPAHAFEAMLYTSSVVAITADSISMVSECLHVHKPVIVIPLKNKYSGQTSKHQRFIDALQHGGYLRVADVSHMSSSIRQVVEERTAMKALSNDAVVLERLTKIL